LRPTEDSENPDQLPRPELNPMLNPLLGQNLGRWAEVYFTSAPEDRDRAVEDLLKELETHQAEAEGDLENQTDEETSVSVPPVLLESVPAGEQESAPLPSADSIRRQLWSGDKEPRRWHRFYSRFAAAPRRHYVLGGALFAVAAILILIYTVWNGSPSHSPGSPAQQVHAPSPEPASSSEPNRPTGNSRDRLGQPSQTRPQARGAAPAGSSPPSPPEAKAQPAIVSSATGAEELAQAKSYLNGSSGKTRDSSEAAKWLWKAVAKQNAEAADLLATLYLTGDGVTKNCDQARVLLDAAVRKGSPAAAERLTHIPEFGCE